MVNVVDFGNEAVPALAAFCIQMCTLLTLFPVYP